MNILLIILALIGYALIATIVFLVQKESLRITKEVNNKTEEKETSSIS